MTTGLSAATALAKATAGVGALVAVLCTLPLRRPATNEVQGYVEGQFVHVASPQAAARWADVERGTQVKRAVRSSPGEGAGEIGEG